MKEFINADCMEVMKNYPDKFFDLAIVDPPYGIDRFTGNHPSRLDKYGSTKQANDCKPDKAYFDELFRVSKNQVIWGYNHLSDMLPPTKEFVFWYKHQPVKSYSDGELAWTSFDKTAWVLDYPFFGVHGAEKPRIHPTQKPVNIYIYILQRYAKHGDIILDTHVGSASSLIACEQLGLDYVGCEIDEEYYKKAKERLEMETAQKTIWNYGR